MSSATATDVVCGAQRRVVLDPAGDALGVASRYVLAGGPAGCAWSRHDPALGA